MRLTELAKEAAKEYEINKAEAAKQTQEASSTFPDSARLQQLPHGTISEVRSIAMSKVRMLFLPRLFLRRWIAAQRILTNSRLPSDVSTLASTQRLKENFPWLKAASDDTVMQLQEKFHKRSYRHGEVITYTNTPLSCMKVVIVLEGSVEIAGSGVKQAPVTLNDYATLERTPSATTVRAMGIVDAVWVFASDILNLLDTSTALAKHATQSSLTHRRNEFSEKVMSVEDVARSTLFRAWPVEDQMHVIAKFSPICLGRGETTQNLKSHLIFVHSGSLVPIEPIPKTTVDVSVVSSGAFIGEVEAFLGIPQQAVYRADFNTNIFTLHRSEAKKLLAKASLADISASMVRRFQQEELLKNKDNADLVKKALSTFPLLGHRLTEFELKDFIQYLEPKVFLPQEVMCSTSDFCRQMILVVRGRATIRCDPPSAVVVGEPVGFTLLVEHKWRYLVVAESMVEAVTLPVANLLDFFSQMDDKKRGAKLLKQMKHDTMVLMNPSSHTLAEFSEVQDSVASLKTLSLYESDIQRCSSSAVRRPKSSTSSATYRRKDDNVNELVKHFVSPNRPLPSKAQKGKSDVFYSKTTRSSTLAFHSKLLKPSPPTTQRVPTTPRGSTRSPSSLSSHASKTASTGNSTTLGRPDSPTSGSSDLTTFSSRRHGSLFGHDHASGTFVSRQAPPSPTNTMGGTSPNLGVTPTAGLLRQRRGRLYFKEQHSMTERIDTAMSTHRQKVDNTWSRAPKTTRTMVSRLYPPNFSRQFGSDQKLSRGHSFASSASRDSGTTPRSSAAASHSSEHVSGLDHFVADVELNMPVPKTNSETF